MPAIIFPPASTNGQEFTDSAGVVWVWKSIGSSGKWGRKAQLENVTLSGAQTITGRKNFAPPTGMAATFQSTNDYGADIASVSGTALNVYSSSSIGAEISSGSSDGAYINGGFIGASISGGSGTGAILRTGSGTYHAQFGNSGIDQSFVARVKGAFGWIRGAFTGRIHPSDTLTADRTWTLPDANGSLALLSDITAANFTGTLPVSKGGTGATAASVGTGGVLLGNQAVSTTNSVIFSTVNGGTISGNNSGDNAVNSLYSGLITNQTHTGDATGSVALIVRGINGVLMSGLATGITKNTTGTGAPSIAVAGDFPTLNQSTTGNAATVTTNANLTGHVTSVGNATSLGSFTLAQLSTAVSDADIARTDAGQTFIGNQTFSGNLSVTGNTTTSKIVAPADSLTAIGVFRADGTTRVVNVDTTNSRIGIGTSTPAYPIHVERSANDTTTAVITVKNLSNGNNATAELRVENNTSQSGRMFKAGAGYTGYKTILASDLGFYNDVSAGHISILNDFTGGTVKFAAGGSSTPHLTIGTAGDIQLPKTITAPGTTGARTINQTSGRVNFAAAATSLVVTNSLCFATSMIYCTIATNDVTANGIRVVAGAGSFTIFLLTAPTTETAVNFLLTN